MNDKGHISRGDNIGEQIPHPQAPAAEILAAMHEVHRGERELLAVCYGLDIEYVTSENVDERIAGMERLMGLSEAEVAAAFAPFFNEFADAAGIPENERATLYDEIMSSRKTATEGSDTVE